MIENVVTRIFNKEGEEIDSVWTNEIVLDALYAYRDQWAVSDHEVTLMNASKLAMLQMAIDDLVKDIPVK